MDGIMVSASTGAMNSLLSKLATLMGEEFARLKNLRTEVKFISDELTFMKDALERLSDRDELDLQTKRWRDIVREMSYDIEEIVDDFTENIGDSNKDAGFVSKMIQRLKTSIPRHRIAGQIEEIKKLVHETSARNERYKLDIPTSSNVAIDPRVATLYENVANLVGVEGPANELANLLTYEEKKFKVASIVGFGGLGKTTLANVVYARLKGEFNSWAFVPVSQKPDISKLLRSLLSQFKIEPSIHASESHLDLDKLREHLQDKRYLIIIDDLWSVPDWNIIRCAFPENGLGSRVIVTTRIQEVATTCCSHHPDNILHMKPLSNEDSRRLFFNRIFGSEQACPDQLKDVSVEILKKCGGLPLAINSISSMLASEDSNQKERWKHVRDSLGSGTNLTLEGVRQILNLSYKDLPHHLKTCLLYLGMYPEDYTIKRIDLERQWMAEGFISEGNGQDKEKVARNYFNELVNRSLIQPVPSGMRGPVTACRVHDMMLDLILLKSAQDNFLTVVEDPQAFARLEYKPRRLSVRFVGASNGQTIFPRDTSVSQVRSVMFFGSSQNSYTPPLSEFKFLRVLFIDLESATIDLTRLLGKLYQLRYLRLTDGPKCQLPTQIRVLPHLQTLEVRRCDSLPSDIVHLPRLMHLEVGHIRLPDGIGNIKSLSHLYVFDLSLNTLDNIKGLGELTNLRYLFLFGRPTRDGMDALCSSLGRLCNLENLFFYLPCCLDGLMPLSPRLETFHDQIGVFSRVPSWMGELHNLSELQCRVVELLNDGVAVLAELPALSHLNIEVLNATSEMIVIYGGRGAFPVLKHFELQVSRPLLKHFEVSSAPYLTFQAGAMPKLQKLQLWYNARRWQQSGAATTGIEHLLALEEFSVIIGSKGATDSDVASAKSDLWGAINMHPNHHRIQIEVSL